MRDLLDDDNRVIDYQIAKMMPNKVRLLITQIP